LKAVSRSAAAVAAPGPRGEVAPTLFEAKALFFFEAISPKISETKEECFEEFEPAPFGDRSCGSGRCAAATPL
jgi:hypothetical protein